MNSHLTSSVTAVIILGIIVTLVAQPSQAAPRPIRNSNMTCNSSLDESFDSTIAALVRNTIIV